VVVEIGSALRFIPRDHYVNVATKRGGVKHLRIDRLEPSRIWRSQGSAGRLRGVPTESVTCRRASICPETTGRMSSSGTRAT
jgi:hypothetical protein